MQKTNGKNLPDSAYFQRLLTFLHQVESSPNVRSNKQVTFLKQWKNAAIENISLMMMNEHQSHRMTKHLLKRFKTPLKVHRHPSIKPSTQ